LFAIYGSTLAISFNLVRNDTFHSVGLKRSLERTVQHAVAQATIRRTKSGAEGFRRRPGCGDLEGEQAPHIYFCPAG
jgi:hypothetical protein